MRRITKAAVVVAGAVLAIGLSAGTAAAQDGWDVRTGWDTHETTP